MNALGHYFLTRASYASILKIGYLVLTRPKSEYSQFGILLSHL